MRLPFPESEVVLLLASPGELAAGLDTILLGLNRGTHMVVDPNLARQGDTNRTVVHEIAHFYWGSPEAPLWFREGAARFLSSYVRDVLYDDTLQDRVRYLDSGYIGRFCQGMNMDRIQKLIDRLEVEGYAAHQSAPYFTCNYYVGEMLFLRLHETMGHEAFVEAWAELYLLAKTRNRPLREDESYRAFLRHTPAGQVGAFNEIYRRWHGGNFPD